MTVHECMGEQEYERAKDLSTGGSMSRDDVEMPMVRRPRAERALICVNGEGLF